MNQNLTVYQLLHDMTDEEVSKLSTALLRIKEVDLLGDGLLRELWEAVNFEDLSRIAANQE